MKLLKTITALAIAAVTAMSLGACGRSRNGTAANNAANQCTRGFDGQLRDQFGRICNGFGGGFGGGFGNNGCLNARFDPTTNTYRDISTGQIVNCAGTGFFDGVNSLPYYGFNNGATFNGCQGWSQMYGAQYIPLDIGYGQMVCMNVAYLYQNNPGYNWNQSFNNYMMYGYPMYTCGGMMGGCGGGFYGGYNYMCATSINLGFFNGAFGGGFGGNLGMCF